MTRNNRKRFRRSQMINREAALVEAQRRFGFETPRYFDFIAGWQAIRNLEMTGNAKGGQVNFGQGRRYRIGK